MNTDPLDVIEQTAGVCRDYLHEDYADDLMRVRAQLLAEREAAAKDREDAAKRIELLSGMVDELGGIIGQFYRAAGLHDKADAIDAARGQP